jgi:hypothetical protein
MNNPLTELKEFEFDSPEERIETLLRHICESNYEQVQVLCRVLHNAVIRMNKDFTKEKP